MKPQTIVLLLLVVSLACRLQTLLPAPTDTPEPSPRARPTQIPTQPPVAIPASPVPLPPTPIPEPVFGTTQENLRVRGSPSTSAPILGRLNKGARVEIVGRTAASDWYQIPLPTNPNARGWVSAEFIQLAGSLDNVPETQPGAITQPPVSSQPPVPQVPTPQPYPYP